MYHFGIRISGRFLEQMTEDQVHWSITCLDDPNAVNPTLQKIWVHLMDFLQI